MAFAIVPKEKPMSNRVANQRLWRTADDTVVGEGHPDAKILLAGGAGDEIDHTLDRIAIPARFLQSGGAKAAEAAEAAKAADAATDAAKAAEAATAQADADAAKAAATPADKAASKPANKAPAKRTRTAGRKSSAAKR